VKVAIPVKDEKLTIAKNAGHTPYFAIFNIGGGMFKTITLEELRVNPKMVGDDHHHHHDDEDEGHHVCSHDSDDIEHIKAHDTMADAIKDCEYLVVKMACKNTANSMKEQGIKMKKYNGEQTDAKMALAEMSF